ncbi:MAG: paraquat-inducible protein A, partial [Gammaproteobacteria bacterium]|nr:paraquat-inducible protein A [Gammaproteobacteria bacterium]
MTQYIPVTMCHDCGLLQQISHMPEDGAVQCCRCDATLRKRQRVEPAKSIEHTLALVITALVLLIISNVYPIIQVETEGHEIAATLFGCVKYLFSNEMEFLAGLIFLTTIGAPLIQLTGLLYILLPVNFNRMPPYYAPQIYHLVRIITSWSMLEVLMLGILVSVVKLSAMATVVPSIALWTLALLMIFIAAILSDLDTEMLWEKISPRIRAVELEKLKRGTQLTNCHNCHFLCTVSPAHESCCPRCNVTIHFRKPDSLNRCTALLIAASVLYIPANLLPVMVVTSFGKTEGDTIINGVMYLATSGDL